MTISANFYEIAVLLIALAFLVLVIALVPALIQLKKTIKAVEDLTNESRKTIENLNHIIRIAGEQAGSLEELVQKLKDVGMKATSLADLVIENIKSPVVTLISLFFGIEQGFRRFLRREKKGGGDDGKKE